jgi:spore coat protein CotF
MFSQKENSLLQDLKKAEEICIEKYNKYAQEASAARLKTLFTQIGQIEQQHLQTINQVIGGTVPSMGGNGQSSQNQTQNTQGNMSDEEYKNDNTNYKNDKFLCTDMLDTEKYVSSEYNTSIFEFKDKSVRNVLNHIQKEEQEHGEMIYNYMSSNGMYN